MEYTMSLPTLIVLGLNLLLGFALPIALFILLRGKFICDIKPFVAGASAMIVFSIGLKILMGTLFLPTEAGQFILNRPWLYCLFLAALAALIHEPGRYLFNRFFLRGEMWNDGNALMFGAGYASLELISMALMSSVSDFQMALLIYQGNAASILESLSGIALENAEVALASLCSTSTMDFVLVTVQQCIGALGHMALAVLVWFAVKHKKLKYLGMAMGFGCLIELGLNLVGSYSSEGLLVVLVYGVLTAGAVYMAKKVWDEEFVDAFAEDQ